MSRLDRVLPSRIRESYLLKFALALLVIVVLIAVVGVGVQGQTESTIKSDVRADLTARAEAESSSIGQWRERHVAVTRMLSDHPTLRSGDNAAIQSYLRSEMSKKLPTGTQSVHYIDTREGTVVTSTSDAAVGKDLSSQPWFGRLGFSNFESVYVSDPYVNENGKTVVAFVSPVNRVFNGAVVITVDVSDLSSQFNAADNGSFTYVVDSGGKVLFARNEDKRLTSYLADENASSTAIEQGARGESGFITDGAKEQELDADYVAAYAPIQGTDWILVKHTPTSSAYEVVSDVRNGILVFIGIALGGVVVLGGTIGRGTASSLSQLSDCARDIEAGDYDVTLESDREDELGVLYDSIAGMRDSLVERMSAARELNETLERKAEAYEDAMQEAAAGDLSRRVDTHSENEAMEAIGIAFNQMLDDLEATVAQVQTFADDVVEASQQVSDGADRVTEATSEVNQSIREISDGTVEQADKLDGVANEMSTLSATIEEIAASANEVADTFDHVASRGRVGHDLGQDALAKMNTIEAASDETAGAIEELDEQMAQVGEVVTLIEDIADQTNILALNASIEAARAGDAGEGFAVVAAEVKDLAEETREATQEISELLAGLRDQTNTSVDRIHEMSDHVSEGSNSVDEAVDAFDEIVDGIENAHDGVQEITHATDSQADSTQQVAEMVDHISAISEETTAEAETVATAADEGASVTEDVASQIDRLAARSMELQSMLEHFESSVDTGEKDSDAGETTESEQVHAEEPASVAADGGEGDVDTATGEPDEQH
ncbi:transducer protein cosT/halobacterial transducer protein IV [Haloferax larsenii JCM 13917]|nr:methyl-accepting chemotaxis protein [Haloferax larsenii]ELZ74107.1 transducer protein cosT/halobacterial transducer protein IV [Haloferax larsenii JCM 13917]